MVTSEAALTTVRNDLTGTQEDSHVASPSEGISNPKTSGSATAGHVLKSRKSLWDILSGSIFSSDGEGVVGDACVGKSNIVEGRNRDNWGNNVSLLNRRSFASFSGMSWVPRSTKRHTLQSEASLAVQYGGEAEEQRDERAESQEGGVITFAFPTATRFAANIASDGDIKNIRRMAIDMEMAWRAEFHKVTEMKVKLADKILRLHDLKDENDHLRMQLGNLSEQIVERDVTLEELQHRFVEQSKKEKEQWEAEKAQIIADSEARIANMTRAMVGHRSTNRQSGDEAGSASEVSESELEIESDEESDFDSVLFSTNSSVNSSIDGELQRQQLSISKLPYPTSDISPTTPKIRTACA